MLNKLPSEARPNTEHAVSSGTIGQLLSRKLGTYAILSDKDKAFLHSIRAELRSFKAGRNLVLEETPPQGVFMIVEGFACRHTYSPCGSRHITAYLLPGDLCDLDVLLVRRMDHSIGALSDCVVALLAPATMEELLERPSLARALRLAALAETANLREWLVNVGARRADVRVAHLLCELHARLLAVGLVECNSYGLPLTQTDLADATGMSTVHTNRSLQELRKAKLIELRRDRLTIYDLPRLKAFAQFRAGYLLLDEHAA